MGAACPGDFLSHRIGCVHSCKEGGEVSLAVEFTEGCNESLSTQGGKRGGIGDGGGAQDHGAALACRTRVVKLAKAAGARYTLRP